MISAKDLSRWRRECVKMFDRLGIVLTQAEKDSIEIADLGLDRFEEMGLGLLVYVNTDRVCAKELAMLPRQTCPEHRHPGVAGRPGKEETFRCRAGSVSLYVPGPATPSPAARLPAGKEKTFTVFHEVRLQPGDQYTLAPDTLHWFQAGPQGAVISEFSTTSTDESDIFTDPEIRRTAPVDDA